MTFLATDETAGETGGDVTAAGRTHKHTVDHLSPVAVSQHGNVSKGFGQSNSRRCSHEESELVPTNDDRYLSVASSTYGQVSLKAKGGPRRIATLENSRQGVPAQQVVGILRDPSSIRKRGAHTQASTSGVGQPKLNVKASTAY